MKYKITIKLKKYAIKFGYFVIKCSKTDQNKSPTKNLSLQINFKVCVSKSTNEIAKEIKC